MKAEPAEELDPMKYIEQPQHDPDFAADKGIIPFASMNNTLLFFAITC